MPSLGTKEELTEKMGGKAAKERRRLLRQGNQDNNNDNGPEIATKTKENVKHKQNPNPFKKKDSKFTKENGKKPKRKVKKPKHLKRKLESLEEGPEMDRVVSQLEQYEKKKLEYSWHNPEGVRSRIRTGEAKYARKGEKTAFKTSGDTKPEISRATDSTKHPPRKDSAKSEKVHDIDMKQSHGEASSSMENAVKSSARKRRRGRKDTSNSHKFDEHKPSKNDDASCLDGSTVQPTASSHEVATEIPSNDNDSTCSDDSSTANPTANSHKVDEKNSSKDDESSCSGESTVKPTASSHEVDEEKSSKDNDSSCSDDDSAVEPTTNRQRGKRRRGRKDTSKIVDEAVVREREKNVENDKKKSPKIDRYCKGRKPVTNFKVGERYPGKVVYSKPFGVFIDIGCHSDAFCHVSRCRDEYIESAEHLFHEGDSVSVRVVEVERVRKRITVSMQSDERKADEQKSVEARQERRKATKKPRSHENGKTASVPVKLPIRSDAESRPRDTTPGAANVSSTPKSEADMTPAELKRARKLARRAARRETAEGTVS